ncbi:hypothetical protein VNO80_28760 [Phaseolus coccineus]|uniref:Uncharacterized protein n=1 Tax=Phaseolus coccineus TaxID=3886 RepID=A0AAN9QEA8_PHACN
MTFKRYNERFWKPKLETGFISCLLLNVIDLLQYVWFHSFPVSDLQSAIFSPMYIPISVSIAIYCHSSHDYRASGCCLAPLLLALPSFTPLGMCRLLVHVSDGRRYWRRAKEVHETEEFAWVKRKKFL